MKAVECSTHRSLHGSEPMGKQTSPRKFYFSKKPFQHFLFIQNFKYTHKMQYGDEREHTLREVAALGNIKATLHLAHSGVNVNSQNAMNGW